MSSVLSKTGTLGKYLKHWKCIVLLFIVTVTTIIYTMRLQNFPQQKGNVNSSLEMKTKISNDNTVIQPRPYILPEVSDEAKCRMFSCFDYSRCSLTSAFPVYLYDPYTFSHTSSAEKEGIFHAIDKTFAKSAYITSNPEIACIYVVLLGDAFFSISDNRKADNSTQSFARVALNGTKVKKLPFWRGDGRNHVLINLMSKKPPLSTGRAMLVQSTFTHDRFRPGFDLIMSLTLGPNENDGLADCAPLAPARRKYLLSYQTSHPPNQGTQDDLVTALLKMAANAPVSEEFLLQFDCATDPLIKVNGYDRALCGAKQSRSYILGNSTFVLVLAPRDQGFLTTELQLIRLYESLEAGAIPVILGGDRIRLPYDEVLDWRRAALLLPEARVTELHFLINSISDADILMFRRNGRLLWERYLSSVEARVDTLLAIIRTRLNIPPKPVTSTAAAPLRPRSETVPGKSEAPYPSPAYRRNFSLALLQGYELWNDWGEPFTLYPQLPWDPQVTSEARYLGSGANFENLKLSQSFSEALGGDRPREQFTIVILTYERENILLEALSRFDKLQYLNKVLVVWNGHKPPELAWPTLSFPVEVVKGARNSLNNRFLPYDRIETDAVLSMDDDTYLDNDEIMFAFRVWRENRDRIVGSAARHHVWQEGNKSGFIYYALPYCELSMVLTGAAFVHRYYLWAYWRVLPVAVRDYVDELMNCEDIAMNFLVAHLTRKPPVKMWPVLLNNSL